MARYIARKAVEEQIRREARKVARYSAKQLIERADEYIEAHREAVMREVLMRKWMRWFEPMRQFEECSKIEQSRQRRSIFQWKVR
jgi:hypothetical protein